MDSFDHGRGAHSPAKLATSQITGDAPSVMWAASAHGLSPRRPLASRITARLRLTYGRHFRFSFSMFKWNYYEALLQALGSGSLCDQMA